MGVHCTTLHISLGAAWVLQAVDTGATAMAALVAPAARVKGVVAMMGMWTVAERETGMGAVSMERRRAAVMGGQRGAAQVEEERETQGAATMVRVKAVTKVLVKPAAAVVTEAEAGVATMVVVVL